MYQIQNKDVIASDASESLFQKAVIITALIFILSHFGPIDEWYGIHYSKKVVYHELKLNKNERILTSKGNGMHLIDESKLTFHIKVI